ncbi:unnamed protein product [Cladocopium goreaui]|uniref:Acid alpha-amylase n=1 Tax=Cladocopium goreaui TaxID=2562237 RepID=A0A9P1GA45_9DINO|nr:unnamed protein product [Cladocopium goreaui]
MVILCSLQTFHDLPVVSSQCVSSTSHVAQVPFDSPEYYHQRNRGAGQSFEDYLKKGPPGAFNGQPDSQKLKKLVKRKSVSCGPANPDQTQCDCMPGNSGLNCPSFDPSLLVEGYLGSLGDLNHSHPFVQQQMLKFVTGLVEDYAVDAFRLDTVVYVDLKFVKEVQQVAWIAGKIEVAGASKSGCIRLSDFIMIGDVA